MSQSLGKRQRAAKEKAKQVLKRRKNWYEEVRDDSRETLDKYIKYSNELLASSDTIKCVFVLLHAYPVMKRTHMELYKKVVEKSKELLANDPETFRLVFENGVDFLLPEQTGVRFDETNYFVVDDMNAIDRMDVCATLLEIGDQEPLNILPIKREEVVHAQGVLLRLGPRTLLKASEGMEPMPELRRYVDGLKR